MQVLGRHFGLGHQKLNLSKYFFVVFHDPQMRDKFNFLTYPNKPTFGGEGKDHTYV